MHQIYQQLLQGDFCFEVHFEIIAFKLISCFQFQMFELLLSITTVTLGSEQ